MQRLLRMSPRCNPCVLVFFTLAVGCIDVRLAAQDLGVFLQPQAFSRRVAFVPGDAFFPITATSLSKVEIREGSSSRDVTLEYRLPTRTSAPLGSGHRVYGFQEVVVTDISDHQFELLAEFSRVAWEEMQANMMDDPRKLSFEYLSQKPSWEPHFCIVNRDFDFSQHSLFLRYNESWHSLQESQSATGVEFFNDKRADNLGFGHYSPFILNSEAIVEDWRNAAKVKPLTFKSLKGLSVKASASRPYSIVQPLEVEFAEVAFVAMPHNFDFKRLPDILNSTTVVLSNGELSRHRWVFGGEGKTLKKEHVFDVQIE